MLRMFLIAPICLALSVFASEAGPLQMNSPEETRSTAFVFPVVGTGPGASDSFWDTNITLLNLSGVDANVVLEFFEASSEGRTEPTVSRQILLENEEQSSLTMTLLAIPPGFGAMRVLSTQPIIAVARIFNEPAGEEGALGQFVPALPPSAERRAGALPMLSNVHPAAGYGSRSNIGWFNDGETPVLVTFRFHRPGGAGPGTVIGTVTRLVEPRSQQQVTLNDLVSHLEPEQSLYVTFATEGGPLYVYASRIDNASGDPIFIPAQ
jgi:hypothetical protein